MPPGVYPRKHTRHYLSYIDATCENGHWEWTGGRFKDGRPRAYLNHKNVIATRAIWEHYYSSIPENHMVVITCDKRDCVNPAHMAVWPIKKESQ